jgi:hypothetical protein
VAAVSARFFFCPAVGLPLFRNKIVDREAGGAIKRAQKKQRVPEEPVVFLSAGRESFAPGESRPTKLSD